MNPNDPKLPNHAKLSWREAQRDFKMTKSRARRTLRGLRAKGLTITMAEFMDRYAKGEQL